MLESGYSRQSAYSGHTRQSVLRCTKKLDFFSPEKIKKDITKCRKLAESISEPKEKVSALSRIDEHRSKIAGMQKDVIENKNPDKVILVDINKYETPSENRIPSLIPDDKSTSTLSS